MPPQILSQGAATGDSLHASQFKAITQANAASNQQMSAPPSAVSPVPPPSITLINQSGVPMQAERGPSGGNGEQTYILKKMVAESVRGTVGDMGKDGSLGRVLSTSRKPIKR